MPDTISIHTYNNGSKAITNHRALDQILRQMRNLSLRFIHAASAASKAVKGASSITENFFKKNREKCCATHIACVECPRMKNKNVRGQAKKYRRIKRVNVSLDSRVHDLGRRLAARRGLAFSAWLSAVITARGLTR